METDVRTEPQHERDDNSERTQAEAHIDLAHTQSKAPRAQESSIFDTYKSIDS